MRVFSPRFRDLWEEWELRGAVFLSLTFQILLICMGNRRKYIHFAWFRGLVWLAYLMADPVAIYALSIITNKLVKMNSQSVDANSQLSTFWSPFLLLHLGGPDTITAYALEDNQLWLRHSLQLVTQAGVTFYIFLMTWTSPNISILTIVMILAGLVKYGERAYVLWAASSEQFRNSIPDPSPNYCKIMEQYKLMAAEGYAVVPHEVIEVRDVENSVDGADLSSPEDQLDPEQLYKRKQGELLAARGLVNIFQRLFVDLLLSFEDSPTSQSVLKDKNFLAAFKIIEIEMGIMYDLLYTKAMALYILVGASLVAESDCFRPASYWFSLSLSMISNTQQLRRGGELLTHVWLIMAHFGLTDHFQIPYAPAIAELIMHQDNSFGFVLSPIFYVKEIVGCPCSPFIH